MPHHRGGDNATKVRRRSSRRNSFCDIFLHDPFAHHLKQAFRFQVLSKNTRLKANKQQQQQQNRKVCFQNVQQLFSQALECPTTDNQGSRFLCDVPHSKNSPVFWLTFFFCICWTHCPPKLFYVFPRLFSMSLLSFCFEEKKSSAHWAFKSMDPSAKEKDIIIIITIIITVMATLSGRKRRQVYY